MSRLILTFETLFDVLAADKVLREHVSCRPTPTPAGLSTAICGVSVELLDLSQREEALGILAERQMSPNGVHQLD